MTREHFLKNKFGDPVRGGARGDRRGQHERRCSGGRRLSRWFCSSTKEDFPVPKDQWDPVYQQFSDQCKAEHDEVVALGGFAHSGHGAARSAAH